MSVLSADNLNDVSPFAPLGYRNVKWQGDPPTANPRNISAYGPNIGGTDERTTISETISIASQGQLVTFSNYSSIAVTLDSTVYNQFFCAVQVNDMGTATFTPSTGLINGAVSASISGGSNLGGWLFFDGTNWWLITGGSGGGGAVTSVFGRTGAVVAVAGDYGVTLGGTGQTGSAKGDIVVGSGTNTNTRLVVGADKTVLMADSSQTDGVGWKTPRGNTFVPQLADSTTNPTSGNLASFDANGNVKDSGVSAASISTLTPFGETLSVGTGTSFTLSRTPNPTSFLQVTKNGLVLQQGVGNDYTLSGTTGTLAVAGLSSDIFQAFYMY